MTVHPDVSEARDLISALGLDISTPVPEADNADYGAFVATVGRGRVRFRVAGQTPKKSGFFVSVWQRAEDGSTQPFPVETAPDLLVIIVRTREHHGHFVFPAPTLADHGILSTAGRGGKRGFRLYPPWSKTENPQARRSQDWQSTHYLDLDTPDPKAALALYNPVGFDEVELV